MQVETDLYHRRGKALTNFLVGSEYHLVVGEEDYYLDLLLNHMRLRCFVVIELKTGEFKPEYAGKMNFYLTTPDRLVKHETDNATIGLILCKSKNKITAEYGLADIRKLVEISTYQFTTSLSTLYETSCLAVEELEAGLKDIADGEDD